MGNLLCSSRDAEEAYTNKKDGDIIIIDDIKYKLVQLTESDMWSSTANMDDGQERAFRSKNDKDGKMDKTTNEDNYGKEANCALHQSMMTSSLNEKRDVEEITKRTEEETSLPQEPEKEDEKKDDKKELTMDAVENKTEEDNSLEFNLQPIVCLERQEVKTGQENDEILFEEKSRTFRMQDEEWKDRCHGDLMITRNPAGYYTIIQREQITKVLRVAHTILNSGQPMLGKPNTYVWTAMDAVDGEQAAITFCAKFDDIEIRERFEILFNEGVEVNAVLLATQRQ